jgi:hypothetical protein
MATGGSPCAPSLSPALSPLLDDLHVGVVDIGLGGDSAGSMNQITRCFGELQELPCWGVQRGHGSFLTFEFGDPHLRIREPVTAGPGTSARVARLLSRRRVHARGAWHLWIYCCDWRASENGKLIGDCSSRRSIDRAAEFLCGQKLVDVNVVARGMRCTFQFDLGGRLETKPYDRRSEQWMLYEPSGHVLTVRADKTFSYSKGNIEPARESWMELGA